MTALVWVLIVIGMLFVLGSFFVTEKLSSSDIEKIKELICNTDLYSGVLVTGSDANIKKLW